MNDKRLARYAGFGGILAGLIWIGLIVYDTAGGSVLDGNPWDYLGLLAALLVLGMALALFLQDGDSRPGIMSILLLAAGSAALAMSVVLYAIEFDSEDGEAFMALFLGTIIMGLGLVAVGWRFRSIKQVSILGTLLLVLGIYLTLVFPLLYVIGAILDIDLEDSIVTVVWFSGFFVQGLGWMLLGAIMLALSNQPDEMPAESI